MRNATPHWYVVASKPHGEETACRHLARRGVEVFFPRLALPAWAGSGRRIVPLFPGYLFVRIDVRDAHVVTWAPGVRSIVGAGGVPTPLDDAIVAFLEERGDAAGVVAARTDLVAGRSVRLTGGAFEGLAGIIEDPPDAKGRVRVLVALMNGKPVRMRAPARFIETGWVG